jgi:hypothetical protein
MKEWTVIGFAALALGLAMSVQCGRQAALPVAASTVSQPSPNSGLPFDRQAQGPGISPSSTVIPPGARIPVGTPISVSLQYPIVSTTAQSGDVFQAVLLEPIMVNGKTVVERGSSVTGFVMEAKAGRSLSPGYIRLALRAIEIGGKLSAVQSSSNFLKGKTAKQSKALQDGQASPPQSPPKDVTIDADRRLTFRLTEAIPLRDLD